MGKIEREGTYQGTVLEHGVSTTQASGYPQWIARLACERLFIPEDERDAFAAEGYEIDDKGWVDCSSWDWAITGYFVLFNNEKALLNYDQVIAATKWDGADFATLGAMDLTEHQVQFRVDEDEYNGTVAMKAQWIDEVGAPINREMQTLDADDAKALTAKFKGLLRNKSKAAPAKGKGKPGPAKASKPRPAKPSNKKPAAALKKTTPPPAPVAEAPVENDTESNPGPGMSKENAWDGVVNNSGLSDDEVADRWIAACEQIAPEKDEDDFTEVDWKAIHDVIMTPVSA